MKILKLNISVTKIKNSLQGLNSKFELAGERINKLEKCRLKEINHSEEQEK